MSSERRLGNLAPLTTAEQNVLRRSAGSRRFHPRFDQHAERHAERHVWSADSSLRGGQRSGSALMGSKLENEAQRPLDGAQFVGRDVAAPVADAGGGDDPDVVTSRI